MRQDVFYPQLLCTPVAHIALRRILIPLLMDFRSLGPSALLYSIPIYDHKFTMEPT